MTARPAAALERVVAIERRMAVSPEVVYRCIADFDAHHPNFLPPAFQDLRVERGGVGAGTVITFRTVTGGRERSFRSTITEPQPGRVLVETDAAQGTRTTFTVTPDGDGSLVRIENAFRASRGLMGILEGMVAPRVLRALLAEELARLEAYAKSQESA